MEMMLLFQGLRFTVAGTRCYAYAHTHTCAYAFHTPAGSIDVSEVWM